MRFPLSLAALSLLSLSVSTLAAQVDDRAAVALAQPQELDAVKPPITLYRLTIGAKGVRR